MSVYADTGDLTGSAMPVSSQVYACMNEILASEIPKDNLYTQEKVQFTTPGVAFDNHDLRQ